MSLNVLPGRRSTLCAPARTHAPTAAAASSSSRVGKDAAAGGGAAVLREGRMASDTPPATDERSSAADSVSLNNDAVARTACAGVAVGLRAEQVALAALASKLRELSRPRYLPHGDAAAA
jgi:hypothetical protein